MYKCLLTAQLCFLSFIYSMNIFCELFFSNYSYKIYYHCDLVFVVLGAANIFSQLVSSLLLFVYDGFVVEKYLILMHLHIKLFMVYALIYLRKSPPTSRSKGIFLQCFLKTLKMCFVFISLSGLTFAQGCEVVFIFVFLSVNLVPSIISPFNTDLQFPFTYLTKSLYQI